MNECSSQAVGGSERKGRCEFMKNKQAVSISYDHEADVMYLSFQDVEAEAEEVEEGIFARYNPKDEGLVGTTILNFTKKFGRVPKEIEIPLQHPA